MKLKNSPFIFILLYLSSCGVVKYGFKDGASKYDTNRKILITQFENNSGKGPPDMTATLTEKTKDYYLQNGDFTVVTLNENLHLSCEIVSYEVDYSGANSSETAQQYKLTIAVKVTFLDYLAPLEKDKKVEKNISNFDFFDPSQTLEDVESELIESIADKLIMDIFNETTTTTEW